MGLPWYSEKVATRRWAWKGSQQTMKETTTATEGEANREWSLREASPNSSLYPVSVCLSQGNHLTGSPIITEDCLPRNRSHTSRQTTRDPFMVSPSPSSPFPHVRGCLRETQRQEASMELLFLPPLSLLGYSNWQSHLEYHIYNDNRPTPIIATE